MNNAANLLQHQINKFGVVTVMDVLLKDTVTGDPILFLDTLKITSLDQEGEVKEIRGGIGAPKLISYDFARSISVEIQDALASMASLKTLWGGKYVEDADYTAIFETPVLTGLKIALPSGVTASDDAYAGDDDEHLGAFAINQATGGVYQINDDLELTAAPGTTGAPEVGDIVKVFINAEGADVTLAINSVDIPPTVHLVGSTFFIEQSTGAKVPMEIEIPLFKINIGGGMAMEAEGDAAVFDFGGEALADANKNFVLIKKI